MTIQKYLVMGLFFIAMMSPFETFAADSVRSDLNSSSWDIVLLHTGDSANVAGEDLLTFQDNLFRSRNLFERGFEDAHYAITRPATPSDLVVWETMLTGKEGVVFLRGEVVKDKMRGTVSEILEDGRKVVDYTFVTRRHWEPAQPAAKKDVIPVSKLQPVKLVPKATEQAPLKIQEPAEKKLSISPVFDKKYTSDATQSVDKFSEEIEKFEKAQAAALKPAK